MISNNPRSWRPRATGVLLRCLVVGSLFVAVGSLTVNRGFTLTSEEQQFLGVTNQDRANAGLPALENDESAANVARAWAQTMAASGTLQHNPNLANQITTQVTTQWTAIAENIGVGPDVATVQQAFMASAPHRANILGNYNRVGIGTARDTAGRLWVALDFVNGPALGTNDPFGSLDLVQRVPGGLLVAGWTIDPDTTSPITAVVYVDGAGYSLGTANGARADVAAAYGTYGGNHAFAGTVPVTPGPHTVCVYGLNVGPGQNRVLGCRSVAVNSSPFGSLDLVQRVPGGLLVAGWTIDPDTASPITAVVYVDGAGYSLGTANGARADVAAAFGTYGGNHAFVGTVPATPGPHTVCAYGLNVGGGENNAVGCQSVMVNASPFGSLDAVQSTSGGLQVAGWTIDPDTASPITVVAYVDGVGYVVGTAGGYRADVASVYGAYGGSHAYGGTIVTGPGLHAVCVYGINVAAGANQVLGCGVVSR
jgi:Cysteine-rich secretory protein family